MPKRYFSVFLFLLSMLYGFAQEVLVCDGLTRFPLRDVEIFADGEPMGKTNYLGLMQLPDSFKTATFQRKGFHSEKLTRQEIFTDTVFLFPTEHYMDEVVVTAKQIVSGKELLKRMPKRDILEATPRHDITEFDIGLMLDKRLRRDKKHVEQVRKIFDKLDGLDVDDPVIREYNRTRKEKNDEKAKSANRH